MTAPRMVIITGLSGAGKTQAVRVLEDLGFFCIDNLPPTLIRKFAELCAQSRIGRVALVIDIRGGEFFGAFAGVLDELKAEGIRYEILFLDASNEALVRRFKESRRPHPLSPSGEIIEGILAERRRLQELKGLANKIIDTSNLTVNQLRQEIAGLYGEDDGQERLAVNIVSFGYKHGIPLDADLVIDVRFLPNPHYISDLRPLTGYNRKVRDYVFNSPDTLEFVERLASLLEFLIPRYIKEGKTSLTIAIGCTGGMHRSVALVNHLGELLKKQGHRISVRHRDIKGE
ncbi:MAG: RNase adapter RapZ [Bacillota bacterium]|uniref:RNase adapter RapZ n=1 Tax=Desulforudis sp. DRI-14 TaxID=3459793 RepID=UPI0034917ED7